MAKTVKKSAPKKSRKKTVEAVFDVEMVDKNTTSATPAVITKTVQATNNADAARKTVGVGQTDKYDSITIRSRDSAGSSGIPKVKNINEPVGPAAMVEEITGGIRFPYSISVPSGYARLVEGVDRVRVSDNGTRYNAKFQDRAELNRFVLGLLESGDEQAQALIRGIRESQG